MAAVEGSLQEESLKRRERLKAVRKKSGLQDEQVSEILFIVLNVCFSLKSAVIRLSWSDITAARYDELSLIHTLFYDRPLMRAIH